MLINLNIMDMEKSDLYEPTPEDLKKWEELDGLGMTAMAGRLFTDEEYNARLQSVIDGSCFQKYLNNILSTKEKTRKKLAALEETEQMLRKTLGEIENKKTATLKEIKISCDGKEY